MAGGVNLYSYAGGNPVAFSDPFGLQEECCRQLWNAIKGAARDFWKNATDASQASEFMEAASVVPVVGELGEVAVVAEEAGTAAGSSGIVERIAVKLGNIASHLTRSDLSGAAKELKGVETGWDHVTEVRNAAQGARNQVDRLNRLLGNPSLPPQNRSALEGLLGRASRMLDAAEQALKQ